MKLVCFSNNTAGGLVCDLLNNKLPIMIDYKTDSVQHKVFKIDDSPTIITEISDKNLLVWNELVKKKKNLNLWYGTHYHPSCIKLEDFKSVICITTLTEKSKIYRWLRYYHGWFKSEYSNWIEDETIEKIDKIRELSKNVFVEFKPHPNCKNIEFEDIVNGKFVMENNLNQTYFELWKENNQWLYEENLEQSWCVQRFFEAKWELETNQSFRYY